MAYGTIIVPKVAIGHVSHQTNLGVDSYDLNELYSPDTEVWKSKVLDLGSPKYPPQVAAAPTRYWFDRSRYRNHGTITGATWQQQPSGVYALNFDGGDDKITIPAAPSINNLSAMTLMAWIKPNTAGEGNAGGIFYKATSAYLNGWAFTCNITRFYFRVDFDNTDLIVIPVADTLKLGVLSFLTLTWDGSLTATNVHIYQGGVELTYTSQQNAVGNRVDDSGQDLIVGNSSNQIVTFDGLIILPRVLNAVLSASQIASDYQREKEMLGV